MWNKRKEHFSCNSILPFCCVSEAEYAVKLNKPIVPLLMQMKYQPRGWLGIILGTKLFFDFSGKYNFEAKFLDLVKELAGRGQSAEPTIVKVYNTITGNPIIHYIFKLIHKSKHGCIINVWWGLAENEMLLEFDIFRMDYHMHYNSNYQMRFSTALSQFMLGMSQNDLSWLVG